MADVRWIKIAVNMFDNEKVQLMIQRRGGDTFMTIWFMLLTLAGKQNNNGVFMLGKKPYTPRMFSKVFRRPVSVIERAFSILCEVGLIEINDGVVSIPSWSSHQSVDKLNELKKKGREKKDKDIDKDKDKETDLIKGGFSSPTLEEVSAYCLEKKLNVDPIRFFSYYTACGWKIGEKPIENWRGAVDMWGTNNKTTGASYDVGLMNNDLFDN